MAVAAGPDLIVMYDDKSMLMDLVNNAMYLLWLQCGTPRRRIALRHPMDPN